MLRREKKKFVFKSLPNIVANSETEHLAPVFFLVAIAAIGNRQQ